MRLDNVKNIFKKDQIIDIRLVRVDNNVSYAWIYENKPDFEVNHPSLRKYVVHFIGILHCSS